MSRRRVAPVVAGALLAMVGGLTCTDLSSPRAALTQVGIAPRFTRAAESTLRNLAKFHLELDNIRVRLSRVDGSTAIDTVVNVPQGAESVSIDLVLRLNGPEERFNAVIDLRAGDLVLFSGTQDILARTSGSPPPMPPIEVEYIGPGAAAVDVSVSPAEVNILSNATASFTAVAFDVNEQLLPDILVDWSVLNPAIGSVSAAGVFTPTAGIRGSTWVIATLPTGIKDSAQVTVSPVPTTAVLISGGGQLGAVGQALTPFVFEVRAADQLPVPGVQVAFNVSSGGGSLSATTGTTDANGRVSVTLTLGTLPGENAVQLLVGGAVFASATATGGAGAPAALVIEGGSPIELPSGQAIPGTHGARVLDLFGNPVPNVLVGIALLPRGSPEVLTQISATSDQSGRVFFSALGSLGQAGAFDIRATVIEPTGIPPVVVPLDVVASAASTLAFTTQPPTAQAGAPFTVAVEMRDAQGNVVGTFTGPVTIALGNNPTQATLSGTLTRNAVEGIATFDDLSVNRSATGYTLVANAADLGPVGSVAFSVDPGPAATLVVTTPPAVGLSSAFTTVVVANDAFGNLASSFTGSVTLALGANPGQGTLNGTLTRTAAAGVATFNDLSISAEGTGYTLAATSGTVSGASAAFDVADSHQVRWIAATGGNWSVGTNWDRGAPPGPADTAVIDLDGSYTVTLDQSATIATIEFGGTSGQQRLLMAANTLSVSTLGIFTQNSVLELSGGTLAGAGGIILSGQFYWTGGTLTGTGTLQTAPGSLTEISGGTKTLTQRFVGIGGNGTWQAGDMFTGSGAQLHVLAGGTLNIAASVSFNYNQGGAVSSFVNGGTLTTLGNVTVSGAFLNAGALSVDGGVLTLLGGGSWVPTSLALADDAIINFGNGSHALGGDFALTGSGEVRVSGGTVSVVGTFSSTGILRITAGTMSFDPTSPASVAQLFLTNGTLNGGGVLNVTSQFTWGGGTLDGTGVTNVVSGAAASLEGAVKTLRQRTLAIEGTANWTLGNISSGSNGQLSVQPGGSLIIPGGLQFQYNLGGALSALNNAGTLTLGGSFAVSGMFNNSGTLTTQPGAVLTLSGGGTWSGTQGVSIGSGALISLTGGSHTLGGTIGVTGTGELHFAGASATVTGAYSSSGVTRISAGTTTFSNTQAATITQLIVSGGTLAGTGQVDVTQALTWSAGSMTGLGVLNVTAGASANFDGGIKTLTQRLIQIGGTATWGTGDIASGSSGQLTVLAGGSLAMTNVNMQYTLGGGMSALNNEGTLTTNGAVAVSAMFNNSATLSVATGSLQLSGGGTWSGTQGITVTAGTLLSLTGGTHALGGAISVAGSGEMRFDGASAIVSGTYTNSGLTRVSSGIVEFSTTAPATAAQLIVSNGTLGGSGQLQVSGAFTWSGGTLTGAGVTQVNVGATATLDGGVKTLTNRTLLLLGNGNWIAGGMSSGSTGQITVGAGASLAMTSVAMNYNLGGTISALNNAGSLITNGVVNVTAAFNNSGSVTVQSGSFTLGGGGTWNGAQGITLTGGPMALAGGVFALGGALDINGAGSFNFSGATADVTGTFGSSTLTQVTSGSVAFNTTQPATLAQLVVGGGSLGGAGAMNVGQQFTWSGGTLTGPGTTQVLPGATTTLNNGAKTLSLRTLAIGGTGTWSAGDIATGSGAVVHILGTGSMGITGAVAYNYTLGGTLSRFIVEGTLQPIAPVTMNAPFDNMGSLVVEGGTFTATAGGAWRGNINVGINLNAVVDLRAGNFTHEGLLTTMGLQSGIGIMRFSGADMTITGSYRVMGATEVLAGRLAITEDFIVDGVLTHSGGAITVGRDVIFSGQEALGGGLLDIGRNFTLTANGDNQRMLSTAQHTTRFFGTGSGRTLQWNQLSGVQVVSRFGQLDIAAPGTEGIVLASATPNTVDFMAAHVVIRPDAVFRTTGSPRFVLALGGATGQGIVIESRGQFNNLAGSTVQITNPLNCNPALELVGLLVTGSYTCVTR